MVGAFESMVSGEIAFLFMCIAWAPHLTAGVEGACDDNLEGCDTDYVFNPPVNELHGNTVNVSWVIMDAGAMDEQAGRIDVHNDIQMWWLDCRWPKLIRKNHPEWVETDLRAMAGTAPLWKESAFYVVSFYQTCDVSTKQFWTPIPRQLFPNTADNPNSIVDGDIFIKNLNYVQEGLNMALIVDEDPVHFTFDFEYRHFPFDEQHIDFVLKFDMYTSPHITTSIIVEDGSPNSTIHDLEYVSTRSKGAYKASSFSPHLSQKTVETFRAKGWQVLDAELHTDVTGNIWRLRMRINIKRVWTIIMPRFFIPLFSLCVVSFGGFCLPVGQVMPRVATGFVSFLSLTVFRNQAYAMVPKASSMLLWVDVAMLNITAIMWLAVMENIAAQVVAAKYSHHAARFLDLLASITTPLTALIILAMLFGLGSARWSPESIMVATHVVLVSSVITVIIIFGAVLRFLPRILLYFLAKELSNKGHLWKDGMHLDEHELALVFSYLDKDRSGTVSIEETIERFEKVGARLRTNEERDSFRNLIRQSFNMDDNGKVVTEVGLKDFRKHFKHLLGGELVRRMHRSAPPRDAPEAP